MAAKALPAATGPRPATPSQPKVVFDSVSVVPHVVEFTWQPNVTVAPQVVSLGVGESANVSYSVDVMRLELPAKAQLQGSLRIVNPLATPIQLEQVAVEVMSAGQQSWGLSAADCSHQGSAGSFVAGTPASMTAVTVPAQAALSCSFSLDYPRNAPEEGAVTAWTITNTGQLLQALERRFSVKRVQQQVPASADQQPPPVRLGACALFSDTFLAPGDIPAVVMPTAVPATGQKAPEAATASAHGRGGTGGVVLCGNATFKYSAVLGPFSSGHCGSFKVGLPYQQCRQLYPRKFSAIATLLTYISQH